MMTKSFILPFLLTLGAAPLAGCDTAPPEPDDGLIGGSGGSGGSLEPAGSTSGQPDEVPDGTDGGSGTSGGPTADEPPPECPETDPLPDHGLSPVAATFLDSIARIETVTGAGPDGGFTRAELLDHDDEIIGTVSARMTGYDIEVEASFEDGDLNIVVPVNVDGACLAAQIEFSGQLDAQTARERAAVLQLVAPGTVQPGYLGCLATLAISVGTCSPPSLATGVGTVACGGATLAAACTCFEKEIEEKFGNVC